MTLSLEGRGKARPALSLAEGVRVKNRGDKRRILKRVDKNLPPVPPYEGGTNDSYERLFECIKNSRLPF
jgi:hypothetical protein